METNLSVKPSLVLVNELDHFNYGFDAVLKELVSLLGIISFL